MNLKTIEQVIKILGGKLYCNQKEAAQILGCTRQSAAVFLNSHAVPPHRIDGKSKSYFLPDILEAVEKTRWKA